MIFAEERCTRNDSKAAGIDIFVDWIEIRPAPSTSRPFCHSVSASFVESETSSGSPSEAHGRARRLNNAGSRSDTGAWLVNVMNDRLWASDSWPCAKSEDEPSLMARSLHGQQTPCPTSTTSAFRQRRASSGTPSWNRWNGSVLEHGDAGARPWARAGDLEHEHLGPWTAASSGPLIGAERIAIRGSLSIGHGVATSGPDQITNWRIDGPTEQSLLGGAAGRILALDLLFDFIRCYWFPFDLEPMGLLLIGAWVSKG